MEKEEKNNCEFFFEYFINFITYRVIHFNLSLVLALVEEVAVVASSKQKKLKKNGCD